LDSRNAILLQAAENQLPGRDRARCNPCPLCWTRLCGAFYAGARSVLHFREQEPAMDDVYAINAAKTEIREAYRTGDIERLIAVLDSGLIDYSDGRQSGYGEGAWTNLRTYLRNLFAKYEARLVPIIIEVKVLGDVAVDYGWHELTLTPRNGGDPVSTRTRYLDIWKRDKSGNWKLAMFIDNADVPDRVDVAPPA
jgi:ketosteroid isomerase-like protein